MFAFYKLNKEVVSYTQVANKGVLYNKLKNTYHSLNETYNSILLGVFEGKSNVDIANDLKLEYEISEERCLMEVNQALDRLCKKGYIVIADET